MTFHNYPIKMLNFKIECANKFDVVNEFTNFSSSYFCATFIWSLAHKIRMQIFLQLPTAHEKYTESI